MHDRLKALVHRQVDTQGNIRTRCETKSGDHSLVACASSCPSSFGCFDMASSPVLLRRRANQDEGTQVVAYLTTGPDISVHRPSQNIAHRLRRIFFRLHSFPKLCPIRSCNDIPLGCQARRSGSVTSGTFRKSLDSTMSVTTVTTMMPNGAIRGAAPHPPA